jgi:hypothetical protein
MSNNYFILLVVLLCIVGYYFFCCTVLREGEAPLKNTSRAQFMQYLKLQGVTNKKDANALYKGMLAYNKLTPLMQKYNIR